MTPLSRREFFRKTAEDAAVVAAIGAAFNETLAANPLGWPIGSQTYPHQSLVRDGKFADLCAMMADIGVTRLELCSPFGYASSFSSLADAKATKKIMADHGIKSESGHFGLKELRESQQKSIDWAKEIGMTQMVVAGLSDPANGGNNPTLDQVKKAADEYNKIGAVAAKNGIQQALHNEQFELSMIDGVRTYDRLFELFDVKLVKMQFQMSTITAGLVGAEYFEKYPGHFISMHVQDVDMNTLVEPQPRGGNAGGGGAAAGNAAATAAPAAGPAGGAAATGAQPAARQGGGGGGRGRGPQHPQMAVGKGTIDWVKTFHAAKKAGVKNYFVEQNWELTKASVAYLKTLKL
jgi:sugar phosphate isomerase/epimerase